MTHSKTAADEWERDDPRNIKYISNLDCKGEHQENSYYFCDKTIQQQHIWQKTCFHNESEAFSRYFYPLCYLSSVFNWRCQWAEILS